MRIPKAHTNRPLKRNYKIKDAFREERSHMTKMEIFMQCSNLTNSDYFITPSQENLIRAIFITSLLSSPMPAAL